MGEWEYDFSVAGIIAILGNVCAIQGKKYAGLLQGVKRQQGFTTGAEFYVYNVISFIFEMVHHGLVVIMSEIQINDSKSILRW